MSDDRRVLHLARRHGRADAVPAEAAVHVHLDAGPLRDPATFARFVRAMGPRFPELRAAVGTHPRCRRLGGWPAALLEVVSAPDFAGLSWAEAQARLQALGLSKSMDLDLRNVVHDVPGKPTFELRVLPGAIAAGPVLEGLAVFLGMVGEG